MSIPFADIMNHGQSIARRPPHVDIAIMGDASDQSRPPRTALPLAKKVLVIVAVTIGFLILLALAWYAIRVLLAAFGGILLAIFLRSIAAWISRFLRLPRAWSVGITLFMLVALTGLLSWALASDVVDQARELREKIPEAFADLRRSIEGTKWGRGLLSEIPGPEDLSGRSTEIVTYISSIFSVTMNALVEIAVFIFVGLYLAFSPEPYVRGLLALIPPEGRARGKEIFDQLGAILNRWIMARLLGMAVIGVLTAIGLWLLGSPLVLVLALLAALLAFIPNIGPVLSLAPAVLVALAQSVPLALSVVALYAAVQFIESYLITPFIQQQAIEIPAAIIIVAQVIMGILLGALGLLLATPLTALTVTLVRLLYVERLDGEAGQP